jgi:hypothetical protein
MKDPIWVVGFFGILYLLQLVVLPKLGIPT